jgi:uncharacterized membrane protein YcaP (DUF421 family)
MRLFRREGGTLGLPDLLVVVVIADAAQNAMAGDYQTVTEGVVLVGTIIFWDYALNWLGYHFPRFQRLLRPEPLPLIKNGRLIHHNLRREMITREELLAQLREQGIEDVAEVTKVYLEADGQISVIKNESGTGKRSRQHLR